MKEPKTPLWLQGQPPGKAYTDMTATELVMEWRAHPNDLEGVCAAHEYMKRIVKEMEEPT